MKSDKKHIPTNYRQVEPSFRGNKHLKQKKKHTYHFFYLDKGHPNRFTNPEMLRLFLDSFFFVFSLEVFWSKFPDLTHLLCQLWNFPGMLLKRLPFDHANIYQYINIIYITNRKSLGCNILYCTNKFLYVSKSKWPKTPGMNFGRIFWFWDLPIEVFRIRIFAYLILKKLWLFQCVAN